MTEAELGQAQTEAFRRKQWDKFLECLRRPPRFLAQNMVDYLRGRAWMEMGHPVVALLFFDNAARLEPDNSTYHVLALECLKAIQDWPELLKRCEAYVQDSQTAPRLLFRAADAIHVYANETGDQAYYTQALRVVEEGFRRAAQPGHQEQMASILAGAYATKSSCLEHLDRAEDSLRVFDEAVARFPENTTLLTARALLKQELGRPDAIDDFRDAVNRGTIAVWSYIEVARHALQDGQNHEALELCRRGITLAQRNNVAAILFELLAIALLRLNDSTDAVRAAFQRANELDPLNDDIRVNRESFERFAAQPSEGEPRWQLDRALPPNAFDDVYAQLQPAA